MSIVSSLINQFKMKPTVHYHPTDLDIIELGRGAVIFPMNHPDKHNVSNTTLVFTSKVISVDGQGNFETENTRYVPSTCPAAGWIEP